MPYSASARNLQNVSEWLCHHIFEAPGAALAMSCDGFFGLKLSPDNGPDQDITGLWRLSADSIELTLFNCQDRKMQLTVGKKAIHGNLGLPDNVVLKPSSVREANFAITGLLDKTGQQPTLWDASSGRAFPIKAAPEAEADKFATAEITMANGKITSTRLLAHSRPVPRFYEKPLAQNSIEVFNAAVAGRYWLLPQMPGIEKAAVRFNTPVKAANGDLEGSFDISGPGLRMEGRYALSDGKLTLDSPAADIEALKLIGAEVLARDMLGVFTWRLLSHTLELTGSKRLLLFSGSS